MRFSIITPSLGSSEWLRLCIASVADQEGVELEHIVQDSNSKDGTLEWLPHDTRVKAYIEKDQGMYDAINRGIKKSTGDILGYLNCDEQYLPGALKKVAAFFAANKDVDVVFGDVVIVNGNGEYAFHRKMQTPLLYRTWVVALSTLSCGMFFRRKVIDQHGFFDPQLRMVGDGEWIVRLLQKGVSMATLPQFTSVFTMTGGNLSVRLDAVREAHALRETAPRWLQKLKPAIILHHRLRRLLGGAYIQKPFSYMVYTRGNSTTRQTFYVSNPAFRWNWGPGRAKSAIECRQ